MIADRRGGGGRAAVGRRSVPGLNRRGRRRARAALAAWSWARVPWASAGSPAPGLPTCSRLPDIRVVVFVRLSAGMARVVGGRLMPTSRQIRTARRRTGDRVRSTGPGGSMALPSGFGLVAVAARGRSVVVGRAGLSCGGPGSVPANSIGIVTPRLRIVPSALGGAPFAPRGRWFGGSLPAGSGLHGFGGRARGAGRVARRLPGGPARTGWLRGTPRLEHGEFAGFLCGADALLPIGRGNVVRAQPCAGVVAGSGVEPGDDLLEQVEEIAGPVAECDADGGECVWLERPLPLGSWRCATVPAAVHDEVAGAGDLGPHRSPARLDHEFARLGASDLFHLVVVVGLAGVALVVVVDAAQPFRHRAQREQWLWFVRATGSGDPQCPRYPGNEIAAPGFGLVVVLGVGHGRGPRADAAARGSSAGAVRRVGRAPGSTAKIPRTGSFVLVLVVPRRVGVLLQRPQLDLEPRRGQGARREGGRDRHLHPHIAEQSALAALTGVQEHQAAENQPRDPGKAEPRACPWRRGRHRGALPNVPLANQRDRMWPERATSVPVRDRPESADQRAGCGWPIDRARGCFPRRGASRAGRRNRRDRVRPTRPGAASANLGHIEMRANRRRVDNLRMSPNRHSAACAVGAGKRPARDGYHDWSPGCAASTTRNGRPGRTRKGRRTCT